VKIREKLARRRRDRHRRLHAAIAREDTLELLDRVWRRSLDPPTTLEDAEALARRRLLEFRIATRLGVQVTRPGVPFLRSEGARTRRQAEEIFDSATRMIVDPDEGGRRGD